MTYKTHSTHRKFLTKSVPKSNQRKIEKKNQLYDEKKITNYKTALNSIVKLSSPSLFERRSRNNAYTNVVFNICNINAKTTCLTNQK